VRYAVLEERPSRDEEAAARDLIARLAGKVRSMPRRAPG